MARRGRGGFPAVPPGGFSDDPPVRRIGRSRGRDDYGEYEAFPTTDGVGGEVEQRYYADSGKTQTMFGGPVGPTWTDKNGDECCPPDDDRGVMG